MVASLLIAGGDLAGAPPPDDRARQNENQPAHPPKPTPRPIHTTGRIHAVEPGVLYVVADGGEKWKFTIFEKAMIEVSGQTDVRALGVGTPVHFYAYLDRRHTARDELKEATIFSPGPDSRPTVQPQEEPQLSTEPDENAERLSRPGTLADLVEPREKSPEKKSVKNKDEKTTDEFKRHFVAGNIRSLRKNYMIVSVGESIAVRVRLAKEAAVKIVGDDYQMARVGDEIEIEGYYVYSGRGNAHQVKISLNLEEDDQGIPIRDGRRGTSVTKKSRSEK